MDIMGAINSLTGQNKQQPIKSPLPKSESPGGFNSAVQPGLNAYYQREGQANTMTPQQGAQGMKQYPSQQVPSMLPLTPTPTMVQQPSMHPKLQDFATFLQQHIFPVTRQYGIPDSVAATQAGHESGYGTSNLAKQNNNFFGLRGHSSPWAKFNTPEEAATYYAQTVKAMVPNLDQIKDKPLEVLKAMQSGKQRYEGDNPNPMQYVYDVSNNPLWKQFGGGEAMTQNPMGWSK